MQWHWGNIGSVAAGLAALIATVFAVGYAIVKRQGPAWLQAVRDKENAQADAAREQAGLAHEQAEQIRLDRRRYLSGWSGNGVESYRVTLVTEAEELAGALGELTGRDAARSAYVVVRLAEGQEFDASRADHLRRLIETGGYIARPPTIGEREALETGLDAMGIPRSDVGQVRPPPRQNAPLI